MKRLTLLLGMVTAILLAPAHRAMGQERSHGDDGRKPIPAEARPPAGMCRIWLDDVPASQQPAPTDCATAVKNKPANGRVIFGDDYAKRAKKDDEKKKPPPFVKSFTTPERRP